MYLVDTDVISDARKRTRTNPGVRQFFRNAATQGIPLFLSAVTIGELRQGVESVRHRGDIAQATRLARWLRTITSEYADAILPFDEEFRKIVLSYPPPLSPRTVSPIARRLARLSFTHGPPFAGFADPAGRGREGTRIERGHRLELR